MATTIRMRAAKIISGPSREELFDSLRLFSEGRKVAFGVRIEENGKILELDVEGRITSIQVGDGSGQSWNITYSAFWSHIGKDYCLDDLNPMRRKETDCEAYYNSKHRTGTTTFPFEEHQ